MSERYAEIIKAKGAWLHFLANGDGHDKGNALCKYCPQKLKTHNSTGTLWSHLKAKHPEKVAEKEGNSQTAPGPSQAKIPRFMETEPLEKVLARMSAIDGVPFRKFCMSKDHRLGLQARGYENLPKSPTTIAAKVMKYAEEMRSQMVERIIKLTESSLPGIVIDEWTSMANRRYLNVCVTFQEKVFNLGMFRLVGTQPAEKLYECLRGILEEHGVQLDMIAGITTDGAAVMKKMGEK